MCCCNYNTNLIKIIAKAISDSKFRQKFLADPRETAREFGFSERDQKELAKYDARKLRALVEGPPTPA
jgi:hypothetical protein